MKLLDEIDQNKRYEPLEKSSRLYTALSEEISTGNISNVVRKAIERYGKLPEDFKAEWLYTLKTEKYKKGKTALFMIVTLNQTGERQHQYCCLGVAGRICGISNEIMEDKPDIGLSMAEAGQREVPKILIDLVENSALYFLIMLNDTNHDWNDVIRFIEEEL